MKKSNAPIGTFVIFIIVGTIFLGIGVVWISFGSRFMSNAEEVSGEICDVISYRDYDGDIHYTAYVDYEFDGIEYQYIALNSYSNSMRTGKDIKLLINPDDPGSPQTVMSSIVGGFLFTGFGLLILLVSVIPLCSMRRKSSKAKKLMEQGRYIMAKVESVQENRNIAVNGRHPYVVYCFYEDIFSGTIYRFKSDNLWYSPEAFYHKDMEVRVYVDGQDYSKYYVDLENAGQRRIVDYT